MELICFSTTNEAEYYRDYLRLRELDAVVRSLSDQEEFFGFRRRNSEYHTDWIEGDILAAEKGQLDVSKRWYLKEAIAFQPKWKTSGVRFSSFRQRYIRCFQLAFPSELAALGKSYVHAYGMSTDIHFTPQEISSDSDPEGVYLGIDRVGLLCFAIVIRCQHLLGLIPEGLNAELRKMHDGNTGPAEIVGQLKKEKAAIGDFVWGNGDICEVVEIKKSKYGYVSYLLRYVERPPIPEIKEDWFAAFEVRLVAERAFAEEAVRSLQTDPTVDEDTKARFRDMTGPDCDALMGQAVARLWQLWQQVKNSPQPADQASIKSSVES